LESSKKSSAEEIADVDFIKTPWLIVQS